MSGYGSRAFVRGSNLQIDASASTWPGVTEDDQIECQGYTWQPIFDVAEDANSIGRTIAAAVDEVKFELQINALILAPSTSNTVAGAKTVELPLPMAKIVIINADNADVNGSYNFVAGSVTGGHKDFKKVSITLRSYQGADFDPANKAALDAVALA